MIGVLKVAKFVLEKEDQKLRKDIKKGSHREPFCREDRIRTCDPLVPNQVFYRAELPPEAV